MGLAKRQSADREYFMLRIVLWALALLPFPSSAPKHGTRSCSSFFSKPYRTIASAGRIRCRGEPDGILTPGSRGVQVPPGDYDISAEAAGHLPVTLTCASDAEKTVAGLIALSRIEKRKNRSL